MNEFVKLAFEHPPRCLDSFEQSPISEDPDENTAEFNVECKCGGKYFELIGELEPHLGMEPLINASCCECGDTHPVIDVNEFGYDAEYGHGTSYPVFIQGNAKFSCSECGGHELSLSLCFTYQFDSLDEFDGIEEDLVPNYFDVVGLIAKCTCGKINHIGDFECT
jgi:hypothetical protein